MANIYQIEQELQVIFDELEENGGELTPELEEKLNITQDEFKSKIKSYSEIVANLSADVLAIKAEKERLSALQKSKEGTIDQLKAIMAKAIEAFGYDTKAGGKFIDYGTGKVSLKKTTSVEVDDELADRFVNRYFAGIKYYDLMNQLDINLDKSELLHFANQPSASEEIDDISVIPLDEEDLQYLDAKIDLNVSIADLLSTEEGIVLAKSLLNHNTKIKASVNKSNIKNIAAKNNTVPIYATIKNNKTVIIK